MHIRCCVHRICNYRLLQQCSMQSYWKYQKYPIFSVENIGYISRIYIIDIYHANPAMQWVQGECRLGSRQWKNQEGSLAFKWLQFSMFWTVLRFEKVFHVWNKVKWVCIVVENIALLAGGQRDWQKLSTVCYNCTYVLSPTCLYAIFHMEKFSAHPVGRKLFGPPSITSGGPSVPQRWSKVGTYFQQLQGTTCHNNHKSACCKFC